MQSFAMLGGLAAAFALSASALAAEAPAAAAMSMPMSGPMTMRMTMAPMPQVYGGQADKPGAPVFKGLGRHHHPISSRNARTRLYFDQGINLLFGFNHAEAIRSFREAARLDRRCAICWWGVAFALGPNINMSMQNDAGTPAWQALAKARALERFASPEERGWIEALAARYSSDPKADRKALDEAFAQAMGRLWRAWPSDLDAGVFYAEAMMDTQPWDYWGLDGVTPKGHATEIVGALESIIRRSPEHPGALHLYIHAVEATTTPERAEAAADRLATLMPGAGHVVHMPSHIYYRVGRYEDAVRANERAAKVDEDYFAACKAQGFYPVGYYGHNIHFLWTSSEMQGRYAASIAAARRLVKAVDAVNQARSNPQVELYVFTPMATLVRFGKWNEVLAEPAPAADLKLDTAVWLYARGFALADTGDLAGARQARDALAAAAKADFSKLEAAAIPAGGMAKLALTLLDGEIARRSGDLGAAVVSFGYAVGLEHDLGYTEPPYWHQPSAHLLGAALLQANRPVEAEAAYRESLTSYREDGWALNGLAHALDAQGKTAEADTVRAEFAKAWRFADVKLESSRF